MVADAPVPERHGPVAIPPELLTRKQWLARTGKAPERYVSHADAQRRSRERQMDGAGFMVLASDPYTLIDVDHCVTDGRIATIVALWLKRLGSYCEYSTSGTGVHVILRARKHTDCCVFHLEDATLKQRFKVEMYDQGRFVVLTGKAAAGLPAEIAENQAGLDAFIAALEGEKPQRHRGARDGEASSHPPIDDDVAIARARALPGMDGVTFARYFDQGADREHHSEEDFHLFLILGKVTADRDQIERIYRRSALMREKVAARAQYHIGHALEKLAREPEAGSAQDPPGDGDAGDQDRPPVCGDGDADEVAALKRQVARAQQIIAAQQEQIAVVRRERDAINQAYRFLLERMADGRPKPEHKAILAGIIHRSGMLPTADGLPEPVKICRQAIAERTGQNPSTVSKHIPDLEAMGYIALERRPVLKERVDERKRGPDGAPVTVTRPEEEWHITVRAGPDPTLSAQELAALCTRARADAERKNRCPACGAKTLAATEYQCRKCGCTCTAAEAAQAGARMEERPSGSVAVTETGEVMHPGRPTPAFIPVPLPAEEPAASAAASEEVEQARLSESSRLSPYHGVGVSPTLGFRESGQEQIAERLAANGNGNGHGNGHGSLVDVATLDTYPHVCPGGGESLGHGTNDSPCSDCGRSIPTPAIGAGRCASCRQRAYAALGWEDTS